MEEKIDTSAPVTICMAAGPDGEETFEKGCGKHLNLQCTQCTKEQEAKADGTKERVRVGAYRNTLTAARVPPWAGGILGRRPNHSQTVSTASTVELDTDFKISDFHSKQGLQTAHLEAVQRPGTLFSSVSRVHLECTSRKSLTALHGCWVGAQKWCPEFKTPPGLAALKLVYSPDDRIRHSMSCALNACGMEHFRVGHFGAYHHKRMLGITRDGEAGVFATSACWEHSKG